MQVVVFDKFCVAALTFALLTYTVTINTVLCY